MRNTESKATKYDWSEVPSWVQWLATDTRGNCFGYADKPVFMEHGRWNGTFWNEAVEPSNKPEYIFSIKAANNPFTGQADQSLEQRPSPCAQCPNTGHKTCCCEVR